jgi:hypothetical protein
LEKEQLCASTFPRRASPNRYIKRFRGGEALRHLANMEIFKPILSFLGVAPVAFATPIYGMQKTRLYLRHGSLVQACRLIGFRSRARFFSRRRRSRGNGSIGVAWGSEGGR